MELVKGFYFLSKKNFGIMKYSGLIILKMILKLKVMKLKKHLKKSQTIIRVKKIRSEEEKSVLFQTSSNMKKKNKNP